MQLRVRPNLRHGCVSCWRLVTRIVQNQWIAAGGLSGFVMVAVLAGGVPCAALQCETLRADSTKDCRDLQVSSLISLKLDFILLVCMAL